MQHLNKEIEESYNKINNLEKLIFEKDENINQLNIQLKQVIK